MKRYVLLLVPMLFLGCSHHAQIKVATYDVYCLDDSITSARKQRLQTVIRGLDADIIGFQDIQSRAALKNILPDNYDIGIIDDKDNFRELAVAVRPPLRIEHVKMIFPEEVYNDAFPQKRDLLEAGIEGYGRQFTVYVHHAKSREGGRLETDVQRERAAGLMIEYLRSRLTNGLIVVLGNFNDTPDDRSINILEYGDPNVQGGIDAKPPTVLYNVTEDLAAKDECSYGYLNLYNNIDTPTFDPVVKGSRAENNQGRGKPHDAIEDVKLKAALFDQILVSHKLKKNVAGAGIFNQSIAVKGEPSQVTFQKDKIVYTKRGDFASDHVPVWMVLKF